MGSQASIVPAREKVIGSVSDSDIELSAKQVKSGDGQAPSHPQALAMWACGILQSAPESDESEFILSR